MPLRVLFVCTANICRSAYAEVMARNRLGGDCVTVSSAGVRGFVDTPMDEDMATQAVARGADPSSFRSRRLSMAMVDAADLVLTADDSQRRFILDDRPAAFRQLFVLGQLARMLDTLPGDVCGRDLIAAARDEFAPNVPDDDVPDPYGLGPEAAAATASRLDALLNSIMPRLVE